MDKIRIYTVAQELGVPSEELLAYLEEQGQSFYSHLGMIDAATADRARTYFAVPQTEQVETVLSPAARPRSSDAAVLDFTPFQVETPARAEPEWHEDDEVYASSQEAVAKVEQKVAAAAQAPVRQSLLTATIATASVAVAPTFVAFATFVFGNPNPRPLVAVLLSIILTAGAIVAGSAVWAAQPESAGFSFGDLMLWSWVRREAAERALIDNTAILGFDRFGRFLGNSTASQEDQMRAVREIAAALDAKSSYTLGHSRRVEKHVRKAAEVMGLSAEEIADLATAAALHDIGNIQIPDAVLRKAGELTIEERDAIEAHVLLGARMVLKAGNRNVVAGIRHHHERWDGRGYPDGLSGSDIPMFARLIGIAEAYDAMTSTRPYRQGLGREHAIGVLRAEAGLQFDADLVEIFVSTLPEPLAIVKKFPFLARVQQQVHELQLVFKRMGAVAISATASTIAIALILGGTVLSPGTQDAPDVAEKNRTVTPIDRVLASRLHNEASYARAGGLLTASRESALRRVGASGPAVGGALGGTRDAGVPDGKPGNSNPGGDGPGSDGPGAGNPGSGTTNPGPGADNGSVGTGPITDHGPVAGGSSSNRGAGSDTTPSASTPPADDRPGKSGSAPGRNKDEPPGKSGTAPGHDPNGPGNSENAPGHNKDGSPGKSGSAPAQNKDGGTPGNSGGSNSGTAPGNSGTAPGNSGTAPGNSGTAPGNSAGSNAGGSGNSNAGVAPSPSASPGSGKAGSTSPTPAPTSPGNSENSNAGGKNK